MPEMKSTREAFGVALLDLADDGLDVAVVSADTSKSMGVDYLKGKYPERCFDAGIAEQNMMMMAAGIATTEKVVFVASYSVFTSMRVLEQLRTFICYPNLNVKIAAGLGGFSAGIEGVTHIALEDLGIVRCIPNLIVLNPADYYSTKIIVKAASKIKTPCYIRLGRDPSPVIFNEKYKFKIGKANLSLDTGNDLGIVSSGLIFYEVLKASKKLQERGVKFKLLELPTIKPIDKDALCNLARSTKIIVTVEEHNRIGGLYSAVCETLSNSYPCFVYPISVPDKFTESGHPNELIKKYKIDSKSIEKKILEVLKKRKE